MHACEYASINTINQPIKHYMQSEAQRSPWMLNLVRSIIRHYHALLHAFIAEQVRGAPRVGGAHGCVCLHLCHISTCVTPPTHKAALRAHVQDLQTVVTGVQKHGIHEVMNGCSDWVAMSDWVH